MIQALTPLRAAVLRVLASEKSRLSTVRKPHARAVPIGPPRSPLLATTSFPDTSNIQQTLAALQEKSLVWKERRGVYALKEAETASLMRRAGMVDAADQAL